MHNRKLDKDIKIFTDIYPIFKVLHSDGNKHTILTGKIDICDELSNYFESFSINIFLDTKSYPHSVPIVQEKSNEIERVLDNHISPYGVCCLEMDHELQHQSKKGIHLVEFYRQNIYPFFANTAYKNRTGNYANGEHAHDFSGVVNFYIEKFKIKDNSVIINIIENVMENNIPNRNDPCLCNSKKKLKRCHINEINFLKSLPIQTLKKDLEGFKSFALL